MRHLYTRRAGPGRDDATLGFDPPALEGDLRIQAPDEGPALRPYALDLPLTSSSALRRVRELEGQGRRLGAILVLRQLLRDTPGEVEVHLRLAHLLELTGEPQTAIAALDVGIAALPMATELLIQRGALLSNLRRPAEAEKEALEVMPWWPLKPPEGEWTPGCGRKRTRIEWRDVHSAENYDD